MAKCGLSIELQQVDPALQGGDKVRGHVRVDADADVRCRSITVYAGWRTRGKGNVAQELGPKVELFSGDLAAGQSMRFPFEVDAMRWPPSYNGYQFSVEHFIETTADIPWAFDPKVSTPIHVLPGETRETDFPQPIVLGKFPQVAVASVFSVMGMVTMFMMLGPNPIVLAIAPVGIMLVIFGLLLTFKWLPKMYVGQVTYELKPQRLCPGESLSGSFSIRPNRTIKPEYIRLRITATETCISGSGSNAKTHRHELFQRDIMLADHPELAGDKTIRYEINTRLPPVAAYSIKLTSNELQWLTELRVGIPGLVDWKDRRALTVVPPSDLGAAAKLGSALDAAKYGDAAGADVPMDGYDLDASPGAPGGDAAITFDETVGHIWSIHDQPDQVEVLVDAVAGLPMNISARIERRFLGGGSDDPEINPDEHLVWAQYASPPLLMSLYVPQSMGDDFDRAHSAIWRGQGEIVGWNRRDGRLQIRVYA
ncbi:MAG TPA: hypothetical protein DDZ51_26215 [Planctomycetaceae bacterium]|nr:hypothetical protein [Planctomycetaceae bacterium]